MGIWGHAIQEKEGLLITQVRSRKPVTDFPLKQVNYAAKNRTTENTPDILHLKELRLIKNLCHPCGVQCEEIL